MKYGLFSIVFLLIGIFSYAQSNSQISSALDTGVTVRQVIDNMYQQLSSSNRPHLQRICRGLAFATQEYCLL